MRLRPFISRVAVSAGAGKIGAAFSRDPTSTAKCCLGIKSQRLGRFAPAPGGRRTGQLRPKHVGSESLDRGRRLGARALGPAGRISDGQPSSQRRPHAGAAGCSGFKWNRECAVTTADQCAGHAGSAAAFTGADFGHAAEKRRTARRRLRRTGGAGRGVRDLADRRLPQRRRDRLGYAECPRAHDRITEHA